MRCCSSNPRSVTFDTPVAGERKEAPMDDRTGISGPARQAETPARRGGTTLHRRFPTIGHMRQYARQNVPHFVFEYMDGGAGADVGIAHNWAALDAVELVPRYGVMPALPPWAGRRWCGRAPTPPWRARPSAPASPIRSERSAG